jgi:hypothetical protein
VRSGDRFSKAILFISLLDSIFDLIQYLAMAFFVFIPKARSYRNLVNSGGGGGGCSCSGGRANTPA